MRFPTLAAALALLALLSAGAGADEPPLPDSISLFRKKHDAWKNAKTDRERRDSEREFVWALADLKNEPDERVLDCLFDALEAPEAVAGHHGESRTHSMAVSMAKQRNDALEILVDKARGRGAGGRALVVHVIGARKDPEGLDFLIASAAPGPDGVPFAAVQALEEIPGEGSSAALRSLLADMRVHVFREYLVAFRRWDRLPKAVPYKYARLHPLWIVLRPDCIQIANITDIAESDPLMRVEVGAYALGRLENRGDAVPLKDLRAMLESGSLRLQLAAARHIGEYLPAEAGRELHADGASPYLRGQIAEILARRGDGEAATALVELSRSEDLLLRVWAIQALAEVPGDKARARLLEAAADPEPFVAQAALAAMRGNGVEAPLEALARAYLSWDFYLCREAAWAADRLDQEKRARLSAAVLAGTPAAVPEGACPEDRVTAGGEPEPDWDAEEFRGSATTYGSKGAIQFAVDRMKQFLALAEGLDAAALRARGLEILGSLPIGPEAPLPEDEDWNEPQRALALAALSLAPRPEDRPAIERLADSLYEPVRLAAIRGLGALGEGSQDRLLQIVDKAATARIGYGENPLYAATVAALAECGGDRARDRFRKLAPWVLYPGGCRLSTYTEVEDVRAFADGVVRARYSGTEEDLARWLSWLDANAGDYRIKYDIGPLFWASFLRRRPGIAKERALAILGAGKPESVESVLRAPVKLDRELAAAATEFVRREEALNGLRLLHVHDPPAALELVRERLDRVADVADGPARTALRHLLDHGDASDLPLLERLVPDPARLPPDLRAGLRRFRARHAK